MMNSVELVKSKLLCFLQQLADICNDITSTAHITSQRAETKVEVRNTCLLLTAMQRLL